jgi:23S rRNA (adenine2030-N6)-methyltransferase
MLAYRHAFHAGNHADVLKHVVFAEVLRHMAAKDKPFTVLDTHAGAGGYSLESRYAQQNAEADTGIGRLWGRDDLPSALRRFVDLVRSFNGDTGKLEQYPGSPAIANLLLRPNDPLHCYELHATDERILRAYLRERTHGKVTLGDGFAALAHELPPPSRRGVLLIDPPYELKADYARTLAAAREALSRFATGVILVWVPQLATVDSRELPRRLLNAAASATGATKGALHARLTVAETDARGFGMTGSSMVVVNPPHGLADTLREVLPYLAKVLGQFAGASHLLDVK